MRLPRRHKDIRASIEAAVRAREDATGRLAETRDLIAVQVERARNESATIRAAIKRMRVSNNLAGLILNDLEKETGAADEPGAAGR